MGTTLWCVCACDPPFIPMRLSAVLALCSAVVNGASIYPHLTLTGDPTSMIVSWAVLESTQPAASTPAKPPATFSRLAWGLEPDKLVNVVTNSTTVMTSLTEDMSTWSYCGTVTETRSLHRVRLEGLPVDSEIFYQASVVLPSGVEHLSTAGAAAPISTAKGFFRTAPAVPATTLRFLATADMGDPVSKDYTAIPQMNRQCNTADEVPVGLGVMIGDISYNLDVPPNGDNFMAGMSGMNVPWMYATGNHEADCNYTYQNYLGRFAAQNETGSPEAAGFRNSRSSRWYSFEMGPVHFAVIDTDAYGFDEVAYLLAEQYEWLTSDLAAVDRGRTPWVVLLGHRPMYCSSITAARHLATHLGWPKKPEDTPVGTPAPAGYGDGFKAMGLEPPPWDGEDVIRQAEEDGIPPCGVGDLLRNGMISRDGSGRKYGLETLMAKYQVNLYMCGHEHNYERMWPTLNGSVTKSYSAPGKPVHVVTGSGGAYSKDTFGDTGPWDAFRSSDWSYSDITANLTHLVLRQRLTSDSTVIDSFSLTQSDVNLGPGSAVKRGRAQGLEDFKPRDIHVVK